ncbi:MAG: thioesterase [Oscillibacter sp.]|jgi:acyl-ACP thioesterase|nr:thioesterase [Oscillibacter sp.]
MELEWNTPDGGYSRREELIFRDCDASGQVRLGTILSLLASTAGHDFDAAGLDYHKLYELRQVFLLSRIALRVHRRPVAGDVLTVSTWENGSKGVFVRRNYQLTDQFGAQCVSAKSDWIIVDPEDRRIVRPSAFTGKLLHETDREFDAPECRKIVLPKEGLTEFGTHTVVYSDLDFNGHVYSGNYGNILWDALPRELQTREVRDFSINYSHEATQGDVMRILGNLEGSTLTAGAECGDGVCFTCQCVFAE